MEEKIIEKLKQEYCPSAILLHGSRAMGRETKHSDWDFILIFDKKFNLKDSRLEFEDQNIECISLPSHLTEEQLIQKVGVKLQHARIVFDTENIGKYSLNMAREFYAKGFIRPSTWPEALKLFMNSKIDGMIDNKNNQMIFEKHLHIFSERALNFWFQFLHKRFSQPMYLAIDILKKEDPAFLTHLEPLASRSLTNDEKIEQSKIILDLLLKEEKRL